MARISWSREALLNIRLIADYIGQFAPRAARRIADRLFESGESLRDFPNRGRPAGKYRELVAVRPYVLRYRIEGDTDIIIRIRHAAQLPDPG